MKLPNMLYADRITKKTQIKFGGLNMARGAEDGELADMKNLTGDFFPLIASRKPRRLIAKLSNPGALFSHNGLGWVDGDRFIYKGQVRGQVSPGQKQIVSMGAYIFIFPDKLFYNTYTDTFGSMEANWQGDKLIFSDGLLYGVAAKANTIQAEGVNWAEYFTAGDAVTITGCTRIPGNNKTPIIREIDGDKLYFYEHVFTLDGENADQPYTEQGTLSISRTVPDMLHVFEHENRLWGCTESAIYSSKWDSPFNWNVYDGIASDAWSVTPTSKGAFTGGVSYKGFPIFFKGNRIYKIYGSTATDFQSLDSASLGLAEGSGGSLAIAGETLFYLNDKGIMAYGGGVPQPMGEAFGDHRFKNAVAGSDGLKYYVSMQEGDAWGLYVFDTQTGLWHKEDDTHVTHFAVQDGVLYFLNASGEIWAMGGQEGQPEETVEWFAEFSDFTEEDPNKKGFSKAQLRIELEENATAQAWVQFNSDGRWLKLGPAMGADTKRSYYLPVIPRRCDHYRIRITGTGEGYIHSLTRETYSGSELRRH